MGRREQHAQGSVDKDFLFRERHEVQAGLFLDFLNGSFSEESKTSFHSKKDIVEFDFILSGQARVSLKKDSSLETVEIAPNTSRMTYLPSIKGDFSIPSGQKVQMIGIELELSYLESMLAQHQPELLDVLAHKGGYLFNISTPIKPTQKIIARQILNCSLSGGAKTLFLQAKTLEMVAYQIDDIIRQTSQEATTKHFLLSRQDEEKIRQARKILKENMAHPPSLEELAQLSHMNIGKLKRGFRTVFGNTAFGCLHEDRMEQAYQLLSSRTLNVSEVAWKVGYSNPGHFSVAFRKTYGQNPKKLQQQIALSQKV